jgi:hypothetical protein
MKHRCRDRARRRRQRRGPRGPIDADNTSYRSVFLIAYAADDSVTSGFNYRRAA